MQLLSKYNKGIRFLLCVIDIFSKYAWFVPLKDKKGISIVKAFQIILKQSNRKPNKIWVDKGSEFYNAYFKKWLRDNDIVMYSTHNEGKSVVAERFIRTLKSKIYKYMTSISKNVYIDKLDDIVDEYNNTYHTTIKMKPIDVKDNTYINADKEINNKDPKFKVGDRARISKYKNIFAKGYMHNGVKKYLLLKKLKILFRVLMLLMISYHTTTKMKPIDVKDNTYINADKEINNKDPKFKVGDRARISKYKNIFAKGYMHNGVKKYLLLKKLKILFRVLMLLMI